jgi:hypothetical protein
VASRVGPIPDLPPRSSHPSSPASGQQCRVHDLEMPAVCLVDSRRGESSRQPLRLPRELLCYGRVHWPRSRPWRFRQLRNQDDAQAYGPPVCISQHLRDHAVALCPSRVPQCWGAVPWRNAKRENAALCKMRPLLRVGRGPAPLGREVLMLGTCGSNTSPSRDSPDAIQPRNGPAEVI